MGTTTTVQSAAAPKPQPATPSRRPMEQVGPGHPAPMVMTVAEMEAAIAALPGKRDALREAFDRLAACSPSPLPFAWEDLDGHISSLQSSITLRFRQIRVLEAAGAAPAAAALGGTRGDGKGENEEEEEEEEEEVEVEVEVEEAAAELEKWADEEIQEYDSDNDEKDVKEAREVEVEEEMTELVKVDEEMHEANSNKICICSDEKDVKETREVEVEEKMTELEKKVDEDEEMQEADFSKACNDEKDRKGGREEVLEEVEVEEAADVKIGNEIKDEKEAREEEQTSKANEQDPDKEMQVVDNDKDGLDTKDAFKASQDMEEEEDQDTNMDETAAKMASSVQHKEDEACDKRQEKEAQEQDVLEMVEVAKNATDKKAVVANEVSSDRPLTCRFDMDAQRLVKLICTNTEFHSEFHVAARRAPDAAALALHVVELFLHNKIFVKTRKVWASCVGLVQMVPAFVTKSSANTIEQAKRVAKDWKEMIDNPESCKVDGSLASWGLLNFLTSYKIVTEFDMKEIFCLFGNISLKQKKKSAMLLKGLGLGNRIPELMDYLIQNGQQMDVLPLAHIFNMVGKYPPLTLLKGYVEKAKQTAMEVSQKNMTHQLRAVIIKELDNLRRAQFLAKKEITNSKLCTSIREEINILLGDLEKKKRGLADPLTASTSNSQQQQTESKKLLMIEQKQEKKQRKRQQEQKQKQEGKPEEDKQKQEDEPQEKKQKQADKLEEMKERQEDKAEEKKQKQGEEKAEDKHQQNRQKHQKWLRQHTQQLPTQGYPAMWSAALRGNLERPPYAAMHGVHHGYPAQPSWPGVHYASPLMPQLGAPGYIGPFTPLYPRPQFYPG